MNEPRPKRAETCALLEKFPTAPARTIARMLLKSNPDLWMTFERARDYVRRVKGTRQSNVRGKVPSPCGNAHAAIAPNPPPIDIGLADGIEQCPGWGPVHIANDGTALVMADLHVPFHARRAIEASVAHGKKLGAGIVILNGDVVDHYELSDYERDPKQCDFRKQIETAAAFLSWLRAQFPTARIVWKMGNHEERYDRYMRARAPDLCGVEAFTLRKVYGVEALGVEVVDDRRPILLGRLNLIHGHEYRFAITNPVNPARGLFLRAKANAMTSHFHQRSAHTEATIEGVAISAWSTGCLCDLHPRYRPLNSWGHGAAIVELHNGAFDAQSFSIIGGEVYS